MQIADYGAFECSIQCQILFTLQGQLNDLPTKIMISFFNRTDLRLTMDKALAIEVEYQLIKVRYCNALRKTDE